MEEPMKKRGKNFTLIELMIVIAIIAILAGMLLPALNKAREAGRKISCLNNMRSCLLGTQLYADSFDSCFPFKMKNGSAYAYWAQFLAQEKKWWPGDATVGKSVGYIPAKTLFCPSTSFSRKDTEESTTGGIVGMVSLQWGAEDPRYGAADMMLSEGSSTRIYKLTKARTPSQMPLHADTVMTAAGQDASKGGGWEWQRNDCMDTVRRCVGTRHGQTGNLSFVDGHAAGLNAYQMRSLRFSITVAANSAGIRY